MKSLMLLLIFSLSTSLFAGGYGDLLKESATMVHDCFYNTRSNPDESECAALSNMNESFRDLFRVATIFHKSQHVFKQLLETETMTGDRVIWVGDLKGRDIEKYVKDFISLRQSRRNILEGHHIPVPYVIRNGWIPLIKKINKNFSDYFVNYVRIFKRYIPWEDLLKLQEGLTFREIIKTLNMIDEDGAKTMIDRYGLNVTVDDIVVEVFNRYFQNKLEELSS